LRTNYVDLVDTMKEPPPVTSDLCGEVNHTLFPLCDRYPSYKEYSEKFMLPLLLHETWESVRILLCILTCLTLLLQGSNMNESL